MQKRAASATSWNMLCTINEDNSWLVRVVSDEQMLPTTGHIYAMPFGPITVRDIGQVLYITDTAQFTNQQNLLCVCLPNMATSGLRLAGTYPIYVVDQSRGFVYPSAVGILNFQDAYTAQLLRDIYYGSMQQQVQIVAAAEQPPMLFVPAHSVTQMQIALQCTTEEIARLTAELHLAYSANTLAVASQQEIPELIIIQDKGTTASSNDAIDLSDNQEHVTLTILDESDLEQSDTVSTLVQPIKVSVQEKSQVEKSREIDFVKEFDDLIDFRGDTDDAKGFLHDALDICHKYPEFEPDFKHKKIGWPMCLNVLSMEKIDVQQDNIIKIYREMYARLAALIAQGGADQPALAMIDKEAGWGRIEEILHSLYPRAAISPELSAIGKFCKQRIAELKKTAKIREAEHKAQVKLAQQAQKQVPAKDPKVQDPVPMRPAVKKSSANKSKKQKQREEDAYLKEQFNIAQDAKAALISSPEQAFSKCSAALESLEENIAVDLPEIRQVNARLYTLTNTSSENLLLIALRNVADRISVKTVEHKVEVSLAGAKYFNLLMHFIGEKDEILQLNVDGRSVLHYFAQYTDFVPMSIRLMMFEDIFVKYLKAATDKYQNALQAPTKNFPQLVRFWCAGANGAGPTFLHKLLEKPQNVDLVLNIIKNSFKLKAVSEDAVLQHLITPLFFAKYKGKNIRARVEELLVEMYPVPGDATVTQSHEILIRLDEFYVKFIAAIENKPAEDLAGIMNYVEDFFGLREENNIIAVQLAAAVVDKFNLADAASLALIINQRNLGIRIKLSRAKQNIHQMFLYPDVFYVALSHLCRDPQNSSQNAQQRSMLAKEAIASWMAIENADFSWFNFLKGKLLEQSLLSAHWFICVEPKENDKFLIEMLDIIRVSGPEASKDIWMRCAMNAIVVIFVSRETEDFERWFFWLEECVEQLHKVGCDFNIQSSFGNDNNVLHTKFSNINVLLTDWLANENNNTRVEHAVKLLIRSLSKLFSMNMESLNDAENADAAVNIGADELQQRIKYALRQQNSLGQTPIDMLLDGLDGILHNPLALKIRTQLMQFFVSYATVLIAKMEHHRTPSPMF